VLTQQNIPQFLAGNKRKLEEHFGVERIGLFGSFATGNALSQSDVDILVSFKKGTNGLHEKKTGLQQYLKQAYHRDVDICTENYIKPYFKKQTLKQAIYV